MLLNVTLTSVMQLYFVFKDLSEIGIAIELMHIQPADRSFDASLFYQVGLSVVFLVISLLAVILM